MGLKPGKGRDGKLYRVHTALGHVHIYVRPSITAACVLLFSTPTTTFFEINYYIALAQIVNCFCGIENYIVAEVWYFLPSAFQSYHFQNVHAP